MKAMLKILGLGVCLLLSAASFGQSLGIGDKAPPIQVSAWVKGDPIQEFAPGKVYVFEFFATWARPCVEVIPQISELTKKFADKASFTGISVFERRPEDYATVVPAFVKTQGDKIAFNIATDAEGKMGENWMAAAEQDSIPTIFVINQEGVVAWIGHPSRLEPILEKVIAKTWDVAKAKASADDAAAVARKARKAQERKEQIFAEVARALEKKDFKQAALEFEKVLKVHPGDTVGLEPSYIEWLLRSDETKAFTVAESYLKGSLKNNSTALNTISWSMVSGEIPLKKPNYKIAEKIAEAAVKLTNRKNPEILDTYGYALYRVGKIKEAIAIETLAIKILEATPGAEENMKLEFQERLAMFKKGKK